mgnify:FL=1
MSIMHSIFYHIIKSGKVEFDPLNPPDYKTKRKVEEEQAGKAPVPKGVKFRLEKIDNVQVEYISWKSNQKDRVIYYIHGGGFVCGSSLQRRSFTGFMAKKLGYNVVSVDYCLAPENPFPSRVKECLQVYRELLKNYSSDKIVFMGESAGGNLVLSTALMARDEGLPLPAGIVTASPTVQYSKELDSYRENLKTDCMITNLSDEVKAVYFQSEDANVIENPYGAPIFGDFHGFPPILINVSGSEVLRDDAYLLNKKLQKQGVTTKVLCRKNAMHAYLVQTMLPEAKQDLLKVKRFIEDVFETE